MRQGIAGVLLILAATSLSSGAAHRILFTRIAPSQIGLFISQADGTQERPLLPATSLDYSPAWSPDHQWIAFTLEGSVSNRSAISAQVRLFWHGQEQVQEVSGGSGFAAQNQRRLHFGLGKQPHIEKAVIRWPSGQVQTLIAPQMGQVHQVKEPG